MIVIKSLTDKLFLIKQKNILVKELKRLEDQYKMTRSFPEYGSSEDENAQEVERIQENLGLQKNIKNVIKDTKEAIKKIDKNKYGECESCKGPIEPGRLKAFPAASLCVTCVSKKFKKR
jgi:DnaK suppressor protein